MLYATKPRLFSHSGHKQSLDATKHSIKISVFLTKYRTILDNKILLYLQVTCQSFTPAKISLASLNPKPATHSFCHYYHYRSLPFPTAYDTPPHIHLNFTRPSNSSQTGMTEPPHKRARPNRPDSKTMWDEADRRAPSGPRGGEDRNRDSRRDDRGGRRDNRRDDRDRDRRYRSRSPRDSRRRDGDRDSRAGRDSGREKERDFRGGDRAGDRPRGGREDRHRGAHPILLPQLKANKPYQDHRPRDNERRDRSRSRSPRREREREQESKREDIKPQPKHAERVEDVAEKTRDATPPVSFKVASTNGQDHDRMELDSSSVPATTSDQAMNPTLKSTSKSKSKAKSKKEEVKKSIEEEDDEVVIEEDDGMAAMQAMMGFGGFGTTHQRKVEGNNIGAVRKEKRTEYRQYMNRVGGFNRPLSPGK